MEKLCPILYGCWLSFKGKTQEQDRQDIECMKAECAFWNEKKETCGLVCKEK